MNKGVLFTSEIRLRINVIKLPGNRNIGVLYLFHLDADFQFGDDERLRSPGIYVRKLGPRLHCRLGNIAMAILSLGEPLRHCKDLK